MFPTFLGITVNLILVNKECQIECYKILVELCLRDIIHYDFISLAKTLFVKSLESQNLEFIELSFNFIHKILRITQDYKNYDLINEEEEEDFLFFFNNANKIPDE